MQLIIDIRKVRGKGLLYNAAETFELDFGIKYVDIKSRELNINQTAEMDHGNREIKPTLRQVNHSLIISVHLQVCTKIG